MTDKYVGNYPVESVTMRAHCGNAVYEAFVRLTEEGVAEFGNSVYDALCEDMPEGFNIFKDRVLISIPGGKA